MAQDRKISVIGLGYVGLPVAIAFARKAGVIAFDINAERINELNSAYDRTGEVEHEEFQDLDILFTSEAADLARADFHIVAVPTPINEARFPNLEPLLSASRILAPYIHKGDIVVYESTPTARTSSTRFSPSKWGSSWLRARI